MVGFHVNRVLALSHGMQRRVYNSGEGLQERERERCSDELLADR